MCSGFYAELEKMKFDGFLEADFGFLENISVGDSFNLYDFLHGHCDEFAAGLSDFYGYSIEYVLSSDNILIHAYCVTEINGEKAYVDARGTTTNPERFFAEFDDWCSYDNGIIYDLKGVCLILGCKDTWEMYSDKIRARNQDEDLVQFFKDYNAYYDITVSEINKLLPLKNRIAEAETKKKTFGNTYKSRFFDKNHKR